MLLAARIFDPDRAGHLAPPAIALDGLQIGAIHHARHIRPNNPGLGQDTNGSIAHALQVPQLPLHNILGQRVRAKRPRLSLTLPCCDTTRAQAAAN